jgi:hypothetical protein
MSLHITAFNTIIGCLLDLAYAANAPYSIISSKIVILGCISQWLQLVDGLYPRISISSIHPHS